MCQFIKNDHLVLLIVVISVHNNTSSPKLVVAMAVQHILKRRSDKKKNMCMQNTNVRMKWYIHKFYSFLEFESIEMNITTN